jgi:RNA polymerase sigma factor (sigma-70 family)
MILDLLHQIRQGALRTPEALPSYARIIASRKVAAYIDRAQASRQRDAEANDRLRDPGEGPERTAIREQQMEIARRVLSSLPKRDREVLRRFYFDGQKPEQIMNEVGLSTDQFRLLKSRAKKRFTEMCRARFGINSNERTEAPTKRSFMLRCA